MKRWVEVTVVTLFCAAVLALFYYPAVFQNKMIYSGDFSGSDLLELNIPRRVLAAQAVADGEMPLWEPKIGNGLPLVAEGQAGVFYPTTLPLYSFLSVTQATNYSLLITLLVAMLGGYAWARSYGISPLASLFSAVAYGLGGAFIFRLKHLNMVQVIAWLPISLALIRWYWSQRRFIYLPLLAVVWSWQFLAGHPHVTYICWLCCYLYIIALAIEGRSASPKRSIGWLPAKMIACTLVALLLSAVQLFPTWEYAFASSRGSAMTWENLKRCPFKLDHVVRMVNPFNAGNPALGNYSDWGERRGIFWETTPFIGIVPVLLLILGLVGYRKRSTYVLAGFAVVLFWAALGPNGGLYWVFWKFCPVFNRFRFPARMLIPFMAATAVLVACGAQFLFDYLSKRGRTRLGFIALSLLLVLSLGNLFSVNKAYQTYLPASWSQVPASLPQLGSNVQRVYAPSYFKSWSVLAEKGWKGTEDLLLYHLESLNPDVAAMWGVPCHSDHVVFEGGMALERYFGLQYWECAEVMYGLNNKSGLYFTDDWLEWVRRQGVSHITTFIPALNADMLTQVIDINAIRNQTFPTMPLYVYSFKHQLPIVRLIDPENITDAVPAKIAAIGNDLPGGTLASRYEKVPAVCLAGGKVEIVSQKRQEVVVNTSCPKRSYLTIGQNDAPGWHAWLEDGRELPLQSVNYAYTMVELEPGEHTVTWRYEPAAFAWGWKVSLLSWVLLLGCIGWGWRRNSA